MAFDLDDDELRMTRKLHGLSDEKKEARNGKETKGDESYSRDELRDK